MAPRPIVGEGLDAMVWTVLIERAGGFDPALLNVAFVFLLLGYGTKVGLAPLHAWLPDAHAEGPTPISAVLSGLLLNVALYALLRFKLLLAANPNALAPGPLMVILGLVSLIFAAFMLYRRRDIKRMFAYSSIEHMGIITFAFGIGGPLANFAGLLHMTMHSLTKSAIFFAVGHIAQTKGTQKIADMGGLTETHPVLGWGLVFGVVAIAGALAAGRWTLVSVWAEQNTVHLALFEDNTGEGAVLSYECRDRRFPSVGAVHPPAIRLERAIRDLYGLGPAGLWDLRSWLDFGVWDVMQPLGPNPEEAPWTAPFLFLPVEGENLHQIPVGPVHAGI